MSDVLASTIKKTRNVGCITVTVFTDSQAAITKILDLKARVVRNVVQNSIYQNAQIIKNTKPTVVL